MADLKFVGAVAIMVACFAVIYPRFMHPLFLRAFGLNDPPKQERDHPPGFNNPNHPQQQRKGADDIRKHMRGGPHPGMRAAAEMQKQQAQQGSGRGMMGVVLPMYAIGIVLYLVYTLFKVFNKSKGNNQHHNGNMYRDQRGPYGRRGVRYDRMGFPMDYDGNDDVRNFLSDQQRRQDLEDLLAKVDDKNVSTEEMRILQRRLEETEAQMSRILQAMQSVQTNVDRMNLPQQNGQAEEYMGANPDMDNSEEENRDEPAEADCETLVDNTDDSRVQTDNDSVLSEDKVKDNVENDRLEGDKADEEVEEERDNADTIEDAGTDKTDCDNNGSDVERDEDDRDADNDSNDFESTQEKGVRHRKSKPESEQ
ncbi:resistance to inhibitors of cholinesterase protein 3-like [Plakobranchus ocellatus]|uniref:Resistance to inhibitors of cholinesterase protein 3-like n=1 Tax=Plakobranchus ocellatus TaxID=259542 RepID=A0AAV4CD41_9GAST|nr:resistance to inhibitors of cholinesterase protein 3-like [Plakobranchus ocellatus]